MPERLTKTKIKVAKLSEEPLPKGPRSTSVPPARDEARAVVALALSRALRRAQ